MDKKLKKKWVAALRSGKFKQGYRKLHRRDGDTYCCLGVLACVGFGDYEPEGGLLKSHELKWVGLTREEQSELAEMNDTFRMPFEMLAGFIQENL